METLTLLSHICSCLTGIAAAMVLLVRPLREMLSGSKRLRQGQLCLLRSGMLHTYYKGRELKTIRQYEYENFELMYQAYKSLRGNSFIETVYKEVKTWDIIS